MEDSRKRFEAQKQKLKDYGFVFSEPQKTEACLVLRPESPSDIVAGKNNAFLIGEAAGLISPSSLEGMSYAMQSAYYLARSLNLSEKEAIKIYSKKLFSLRVKIFAKLVKCPFMYNRHLRYAVMKSGLQSIKLYTK